MHKLICFAVALAALGSMAEVRAEDQPEAPKVMPISVSAANYTGLSKGEIRQIVNQRGWKNPVMPRVSALDVPQTYLFVPGERYEGDLSFKEVCQHLEAALAKKGFRNVADANGKINPEDKIDLILRVASGMRTWREPTVRDEHLEWRHGLEPTLVNPRTIAGARVAFERRAGGNDHILSDLANLSGGSGSSRVDVVGAYNATREFYLLVVDAFSYLELKEDQAKAKRLWSTFIALPKQGEEKFSEVFATMLRVGTPYFGETTEGLQMFDDARANVRLGELNVLEVDVKTRPGK